MRVPNGPKFRGRRQPSGDVPHFISVLVNVNKNEIVFGSMKGFPLPLLQIIHVFGLYWFVNIIVNVGMFVLSGTFSQWYWTQRDDFKDLADNPVCLSEFIFCNSLIHPWKTKSGHKRPLCQIVTIWTDKR